MKHLITIIIAGFLFSTIMPDLSYSQNSQVRPKTSNSHQRAPVKISKEEAAKKIKENTKVLKKDLRGTWTLEEDFELGIFPPSGWTIGFGATEWELAFYSGYGIGDYSMFYSSWTCNYSDNTIYSPSFSPTVFGDQLIFDYAYAPYEDKFGTYYDDMEIYYYDDIDQSWYSLIYYSGFDLQTAPSTGNYFEPGSNEWGTKYVDIPENATQLYFQVYENCSNNLYIDNIKVGTGGGGPYDASVEFVWAKGKLPLTYGVPETIPVLIKNTGGSTIFNLDVSLDITGANNLSDVIQIPMLNPGDTMQIDFMGFTPILNGFCDVTVTIPSDDDPNNNTKTFLTEVNPNVIRHVDSNCCNASVGWLGEAAFLNKYKMNGTGLIRNVNIKISGGGNVDQIVYAYVLTTQGQVVGKSPHYKIKAEDQGKYKSFPITYPGDYSFTDAYYYVGIAQTEYAGDGFVFTPQEFLYETPARPDANYFAGLVPVGQFTYLGEFDRQYGQNYAIEAVISDIPTADAGVVDLGPMYEQYYTSTTYTPVGRVYNPGTTAMTFNIRRTITPGGYSSTKTVTGLNPNNIINVNFDPWTFTSGTTYTVRDSILSTDNYNANNQMTSTITPRVAKQMCVLWSQQDDRDSLVRAINADGRYANNFDTVRVNYTGSYRPWRIIFAEFKNVANYSPWMRDSLKMFLDNSTAGNKKSLIVFGNAIAYYNDPNTYFPTPADSIFYRQYLKSSTISDNWPASIPASENRFRGIGFFNGITQDSLSDPDTPELIKPVNGGIAIFKPQSVTGNGADSCNAVGFIGSTFNSFFMTNKFSSLRATNGSPSSPMGPVMVYTKIIDWLQSSASNAKSLDLTAQIEGFYDPSTNSMNPDTMRVYLRSSVSPFPRIDSAKAYLNAAGQGSFLFNNASNGVGYYIQLKHRNGLETWSKTTQSFASNHLVYNFTTDSAKAYGNNLKKSGSKWVIYTGDENQDGSVDLTDVLNIYNAATAFTTGYVRTDVNGNGFTDLTDLILAYNNSVAFVLKKTPVPPGPTGFSESIFEQDNFNNTSAPDVNSENSNESKIDHEIYEKFKNTKVERNSIPDINFYENGKSVRIDGSKILR